MRFPRWGQKETKLEVSAFATKPAKGNPAYAVVMFDRYLLSEVKLAPFVYMNSDETRRLGQHLLMLADVIDSTNRGDA